MKLIFEFILKALVYFVYIVQIQMTLPKNIVRYIINLRHLIIFAYYRHPLPRMPHIYYGNSWKAGSAKINDIATLSEDFLWG